MNWKHKFVQPVIFLFWFFKENLCFLTLTIEKPRTMTTWFNGDHPETYHIASKYISHQTIHGFLKRWLISGLVKKCSIILGTFKDQKVEGLQRPVRTGHKVWESIWRGQNWDNFSIASNPLKQIKCINVINSKYYAVVQSRSCV